MSVVPFMVQCMQLTVILEANLATAYSENSTHDPENKAVTYRESFFDDVAFIIKIMRDLSKDL
jgi:hypothetical protein